MFSPGNKPRAGTGKNSPGRAGPVTHGPGWKGIRWLGKIKKKGSPGLRKKKLKLGSRTGTASPDSQTGID